MKSHKFFIVSMLFLAAFGWTGAWAEVNVNKASASELAQALKNVGLAKAAAIVEYRKMHGAFKSADELAEVHGIGKATVEMNRDRIILSDPKPDAGVSNVSDVADPKPDAGVSNVSGVTDSKPRAVSAPGVPPVAPAASESKRMGR